MAETTTPSGDAARLFTLFNEIGIINQLATTRFERALPDDLTLSQFQVLNNFVRLGGTRTPAGLANAFQVTRGAMTNTLKKLLARGCVTITPSPADGRSKEVAITRQGERLRAQALMAASPALNSLSGIIDPAQVSLLLPALQALRAQLDQERD